MTLCTSTLVGGRVLQTLGCHVALVLFWSWACDPPFQLNHWAGIQGRFKLPRKQGHVKQENAEALMCQIEKRRVWRQRAKQRAAPYTSQLPLLSSWDCTWASCCNAWLKAALKSEAHPASLSTLRNIVAEPCLANKPEPSRLRASLP